VLTMQSACHLLGSDMWSTPAEIHDVTSPVFVVHVVMTALEHTEASSSSII
jgi:hypothetical protein